MYMRRDHVACGTEHQRINLLNYMMYLYVLVHQLIAQLICCCRGRCTPLVPKRGASSQSQNSFGKIVEAHGIPDFAETHAASST